MRDFSELVELDLANDATEEALKILEANPVQWRDELVIILQEHDAEFTERRQEVDKRTSTHEYLKKKEAYSKWKAAAVQRKIDIIQRLKEVKQLVTKFNTAQSAKETAASSRRDLFPEILAELQAIRILLETRVS